jgi:hypothetical protein
MSFHAVTSFTFDGIVNYISTLQPTNIGLQLSVMCADTSSELTSYHLRAIRDAIAEKVDGRFDFEMHRDVESSFGSDSD